MINLISNKAPLKKIALDRHRVKGSVILGIAIIMSLLINLPRSLQALNLLEGVSESFEQVSLTEMILRFSFLFIFSFVLLHFNANWKYNLGESQKSTLLLMTFIANALWYLMMVQGFLITYEFLLSEPLPDFDRKMLFFIYFVVLLISIFIAGLQRYQMIRQQDNLEKERLKKQSLENELMALKNQVNPHFLFNSLNSLVSMVNDNPEATNFVNKLSFMYRYILQSGQRDLVSLSEELQFLESYVHLIKARYRERVAVKIQIDERLNHAKIPAMSLQLLVENAVKHNEISAKFPLLVEVFSKDGKIIVQNKIRPRKNLVTSTGQGLANIRKRFEYLLQSKIVISNQNDIFKVELPIN